MAPHGKQMTPEEKQIIVALSQGYSSYKIAEITGENRRTGDNSIFSVFSNI
jgi:DNA-binding CsgD family transcriptional regulator